MRLLMSVRVLLVVEVVLRLSFTSKNRPYLCRKPVNIHGGQLTGMPFAVTAQTTTQNGDTVSISIDRDRLTG